MRAHDWSATPLGSPEHWPRTMQTTLRIMLDSRHPMFIWWGKQRIHLYNDAYIPLLARLHPSALGKPAQEVWPEIWSLLGPHSEAVLQGGVATWNEQVLLTTERKGFPEEAYFTFSQSPIPDDNGGVGGVLCACTEETQRVLAVRRFETLRALGARTNNEATRVEDACASAIAALANNAYDVPFVLLYLLDEESKLLRLCSSSGIDASSALSPRTVALNGGDAVWPFQVAAATGTAVLAERLASRLGSPLAGPWPEPTERALVMPLPRVGGKGLAGFLIAGVSPRLDLDDAYRDFLRLAAQHTATAIANASTRSAEQQDSEDKSAARAEAVRANELKDEFLGTLGHELRTPLAAITLWASALRSKSVTPAEVELAVDAILQSAESQSRLIEDLLDLSRIEAAKLRIIPRPTQVAEVVSAALRTVQPSAKLKQQTLVVEVEDGLNVVLDPTRLQQVLWNLLTNAVKFTPNGGEITLKCRRRLAWLELEVKDTGEGITADLLPHVFERFRQRNMLSGDAHGGLGIGLALTRHLVELHGGTIEAISDGPGCGSLFRVRLPWIEAGSALDSGTPESASSESSSQALRGAFVLLVEDDEGTREAMQWTLSRAGATVRAVATAPEALRELGVGAQAGDGDQRVDVVVCDLGLPGMSGYELIEKAANWRLARGCAPIPACAVSAHARDADRHRAIESGFDLYLAKPVTPAELVRAVQDLLAVGKSAPAAVGSPAPTS